MKKRIVTLGILLCFFVLGKAQEEAKAKPRDFTLTEAVAFADEHAYEVVNSSYDLRGAKKRIWEAIAAGLPQVNVAANYNDNLKLPTQLLPAEMMGGTAGDFVPVKFGQQFTADASVTATQLLFNGSYIVGLKASKVYYKLSENTLEKTKESIREAVLQAYFYVLSSEMNYKTMQENLKTNEDIYKETKAYCDEGLREDTDADQAELAVRSSEAALQEAKRSIAVARTTLKYLMGIDVNEKITLKSSLDDLIATLLLSKEENQVEWTKHIDYRILETQYDAQRLVVKNEQAGYLPVLSAFYNVGRNTSSSEWNITKSGTDWYKSSILGLKLTLPVFTSGMKHSKVQQEKLKLEKVASQMQQSLQKMQQDKMVAENTLQSAKATYTTSSKSRKLAERIFGKTQLKYKEGVSNSVELAQMEQQYLQAHGAYIKAMLDLLNAGVAYRKATGKL